MEQRANCTTLHPATRHVPWLLADRERAVSLVVCRAMAQVNSACDSNANREGLQVPDCELGSRRSSRRSLAPLEPPQKSDLLLLLCACAPLVCDDACATAYLPVYNNCHDILQAVADQQGGRRAVKVMRQFDHLADSCREAQADEVVISDGDEHVDGATYFITDARPLVQGTELQPIDIPLDHDIGFTITPNEATEEGWSSIIHISASGENCCNYGDRIPGIFFHPGTHRLHIRDGSTDDGNDGCDPPDELPAGVPTTVKLEIRATSIAIYFNDEVQVHCDRGARDTHTSARVWASDPWHAAANALLGNFYLVCDSDSSTPGLQVEPDEDPVSMCSSALAPPPPAVLAAEDVRGATYLIRAEQPLSQGNELQQVDIPLDYDIGFTLTPTATNVDGWGNIIHISASGENCCE